jgi:hypothetical protein
VDALGVGLSLMAPADVLGQVFGQVADAPAGVLGPGQHALGVEAEVVPATCPIEWAITANCGQSQTDEDGL